MNNKINKKIRIGITTRVTNADAYVEYRDTLAHDWANFMSNALPECTWIMLPNIGEKIIQYVQYWDLNGFILTGGNDIGTCLIRDLTEKSILKYAENNILPVIGVCRGLQLIQTYYGGAIEKCPESHVGKTHKVIFTEQMHLEIKEHEVNSFHQYGIRNENISPNLIPLALTNDGWVESARNKTGNIHAIMWHPERCSPVDNMDRVFFRGIFGLE